MISRSTALWTVFITLAVTLGVIVLAVGMSAARGAGEGVADPFAAALDLDALGRLPVQTGGRFKSLDSYANEVMSDVTGPRRIDGASRTFTYLDMMFRPGEYAHRDVIYIRKKNLREDIVVALLADPTLRSDEDLRLRLDRFMDTGLISPHLLQEPAAAAKLDVLRRDLISTAKFVNEIDFALFQMRFENLMSGLRLAPPPGAMPTDSWLTLDEFTSLDTAAGGIEPSRHAALSEAWRAMAISWINAKPDEVNRAVADLVSAIPAVNPAAFPSATRASWPWSFTRETAAGWMASIGVILGLAAMWLLARARGWRAASPAFALTAALLASMQAGCLALGTLDHLALESFYFRNFHWTVLVWVIYLASMLFLLMSIVYRWPRARLAGLTIFGVAFALQTASLLIRWYVADRWPNSNMFEAVTTAAWFGGGAAVVLEALVRGGAMKNLFALGSAAASMVALMAAHFLPQSLDANISNRMPVLDDVWLYIHTNVIIFSYVLIFVAAVVAVVYLVYRFARRLNGLDGLDEYARVGGAGSLIVAQPGGGTLVASPRATLGQIFDGATMILMEASFVLLWAGIVMGAMWADHSWGRPWGWDPKEVFALNTFIVFAVLVHVRLKVRDKGLWTSLLVIVGCVVMLFNWIFINFKIAGLHSYA